MKKQWISVLTAAVLLIAPALAEKELTRALPQWDLGALERYASYQSDALTGAWSVRGTEADSGLTAFWDTAKDYSGGLGFFCVEAEGSEQTGMIQPVLAVYFHGSKPINAFAVSLRADDMRCDFPAVCEDVTKGTLTCQRIRVPLDETGLQMLSAAEAAETVMLRIHGDTTYTIKPVRRDRYADQRQRIESASLTGLMRIADELNAMGMDRYGFWQENTELWESLYHLRPAAETCSLFDPKAEPAVDLDDDMEQLCRGNKNSAVRQLQKLLSDKGFLLTANAEDTSFGRNTQDAVKHAQQYYGLVVTGSADRRLTDILADRVSAPDPQIVESAIPQLTNAGGVAEMDLNRCWFAAAVTPSRSGEAQRAVLNGDNTLLIADGVLRNVSGRELNLYIDLTGTLSYGGKASFDVSFACECDHGTQFGSTLLPMGETRLVAYAEVPAYLANETGERWTLTITAGGKDLIFCLDA